ncbi:MAG: group I truncated hemoglobin [Nocardioidaceae bacterium]
MTERAEKTDQTDYERVGGADAVTTVVQLFYERVLADPELSGYFTGVDIPRLKRHQVLLISQVLGGPAEYDGRDLRDAHAGMSITSDHYARVFGHLVAVLHDAGVEAEIIGRVGTELAGAERDIVSSSTA